MVRGGYALRSFFRQAYSLGTMATLSSECAPLELDSFALRQFMDAGYAGTKIPISPEKFMDRVLKFYHERAEMQREFPDRPVLIDGYAPFCKHIFMPNFWDDIRDGAMRITGDNKHLLRTKYEARNDKELPVLTRYFSREDVQVPRAEYLDLICMLLLSAASFYLISDLHPELQHVFLWQPLTSSVYPSCFAFLFQVYSREQVLKEHEAMGKTSEQIGEAPWRIIGIKGQGVPYEIPM